MIHNNFVIPKFRNKSILPLHIGKRIRDASIYTSKKYRSSFYS